MTEYHGGASSQTAEHSAAHPSLDPYHMLAQPRNTTRQNISQDSSNPQGMTTIAESASMNRTFTRSSSGQTSSTLAGHHIESHGQVRTLPVWIESFEMGGGVGRTARVTDSLLPAPLSQVHSAHHHYAACQTPRTSRSDRRMSQDGYVSDEDSTSGAIAKAPERGIFGGGREPVRGRKWDHARDADPVIMTRGPQMQSPWVVNLMKSSMYGPAPNEDRRKVSNDFLDKQTPGYSRPWRGDIDDMEKGEGLLHDKKRRKLWYQRAQHTLLMHPLVPLAFRLTNLVTSIVALALACSIYAYSEASVFPQTPSTIMAIVVDTVAIPYICYITWDEYTGKPLGLRSPKAKIRLVLCDLFFIIFESANLAIAFSALSSDSGSCRIGNNGIDLALCDRVKALVSFLFVVLIAWDLTFVVSIFRLVERVGGKEEGD